MLNRRNFLLNLFAGCVIGNKNNTVFSHDDASRKRNKKLYRNSHDVLIIVDVQNDFFPGGSLPVKNGDKIIDTINKIQTNFQYVVLTQDWHPEDHSSFSDNPVKKIFLQRKCIMVNRLHGHHIVLKELKEQSFIKI